MLIVTATILPLNVFQMDALGDFCFAKLGKRLPDKLEKSTTGNYAYATHFFFRVICPELERLLLSVDGCQWTLVAIGSYCR